METEQRGRSLLYAESAQFCPLFSEVALRRSEISRLRKHGGVRACVHAAHTARESPLDATILLGYGRVHANLRTSLILTGEERGPS